MKSSSLLHPTARFLLSLIFIASGIGKISGFEQTLSMMSSVAFPMPELFLVAAVIIEVVGGVALLLGLRTRYAAIALIIFVVAATIIFHARFIDDPVSGHEQIVHTFKNIAIIGGLLKFAIEGGGSLSLDNRFERTEILI